MDNILIIGAHPDDIELGCMGTLLKLKKEGKKVVCLIMTNGGNWEKKTHKDRLQETSEVSEILKIDEYIVGDFKDGYVKHNSKVIDFIVDIVNKYTIDTIFVQYFKDTHQDHINTCLSTMSACGLCKNLIFYESLTSKEFVPNYFVDITDFELEKEKLLELHISQIEKYRKRNQNLISYINAKDILNGIKIHTDYAEGFMIYKMTM